MDEEQSKKSLIPRLTSENVTTKEDDEIFTNALAGSTRLIPRKSDSRTNSRGTPETESLPPSSPRSPGPSRLGPSPPPQHTMTSPTTTLSHPLSPMEREGPRAEWQNTWGQVSQNAGYPYSVYPTNPAHSQWSTVMNASAANWYNAQPIQFHDHNPTPVSHQHTHHHHQQPPYMSVDVTMGNAFSSFGQTSSALSGAMSPYEYSPQQTTPPQNNPAAHWQNLFVEMGANYS